MGFPLAFAETRLLFQLVGPATTAELLMQGRMFTAQEALESRIVSRVATPDRLQELLDDVVSGILKSGRQASRSHKHQLRRLLADQGPLTQEERFAEYAFAGTEEYQQGIRRFLQRKSQRTRKEPAAAALE
jgi:enoyl-CoA hydratase/carnithine racemase